MTFGCQHYVPVLKVKRAEKDALRSIRPLIRPSVIPLLELVERTKKTLPEHLDTAFKGLAASTTPFARCFIDARELAPDGPAAARAVFGRAAADGIAFTPVTGLSGREDLEAALNHRQRGLALRLTRPEYEQGGLRRTLAAFMAAHKLSPEEVDLIVDLGAVSDLVADGVRALADAFIGDVPDHARWRTFTLSACAFPLGLGDVSSNSHQMIDRSDWQAWRDGFHSRRSSIPRLATYSDGVIQHPRGVEGLDFTRITLAASIRYASTDSWLIIKGESTKKTSPGEQFPALARRLVGEDELRAYYAGSSHCPGCASIKAAADGARGGLARLEDWRRFGTIHHITAVVAAINGLPWP